MMTNNSAPPVMRVVDVRRPLDLEALLHWAVARELADEALHAEGGESWLIRSRSADGCAELLRRWEVGDAGRSVSAGGAAAVHPDALRVWATVRNELAEERPALSLVRECARGGVRPDWGQGLPVVQLRPADLVQSGRRLRARERVVRGGARYCPVKLVDNAEELRRRRVVYGIWWEAMARLAARLAAVELLTRRCTGFRAPRRPWEESAIFA